jgi:hypothetical protein
VSAASAALAPAGAELAGDLLDAARAGQLERAREISGRLDAVDPLALRGDEERLAFWINVYNARVLHELGERPRSGNLIRHSLMFSRVGYSVGGLTYTLNQIEHGLLRRNARPPFSPRRTLRRGDPRHAAAPVKLDPRIHFALNCAARSCPPVSAYEADRVDDQLTLATRAYIQAETVIDRAAGEVTLPYLIKLYAPDFGEREAALDLIAAHLPENDRDWLRWGEGARARIRFGRYDWTIAAAGG